MAKVRDGRFAPLKVKLLWTVVFLGCFTIGRYIPVPLLHDAPKGAGNVNSHLLDSANAATGGNFFHPSLFSLGLGPWMVAAILWRFLFIGKIARDRKIPEDTVGRARNGLMVVLAVFQAISLMSRFEIGSLSWGPFSDRLNAQIVIVLFLTAGAILVAWMGNKNEDLGLGGITIFVLYQIVFTARQNLEALSISGGPHSMRVLWLAIAACVCVVIVGVLFGNAEVRLHVNKVAIDSGYTGMSYLPIKLNPAGASPIMYALALLALPQYVAHAVGAAVPAASAGVNRFVSTWGLSSPVGFTVYLLLLFGLTIFFGLFTVNPKDIAERMQKGGEYFDHVLPGRATRQYLRRQVVRLSVFSGVFLVIFAGLPLYYIGSYPNLQYVLTGPGTLIIVVGLLWMLREEIADTTIGTKYAFAFETSSGNTPLTRSSSSGAAA